MPKMKTCRGAAKRFKVKKTQIKRGSAFRSHILTKKTQKTIRGLKAPQSVHSANEKAVKSLLAMN